MIIPLHPTCYQMESWRFALFFARLEAFARSKKNVIFINTGAKVQLFFDIMPINR